MKLFHLDGENGATFYKEEMPSDRVALICKTVILVAVIVAVVTVCILGMVFGGVVASLIELFFLSIGVSIYCVERWC